MIFLCSPSQHWVELMSKQDCFNWHLSLCHCPCDPLFPLRILDRIRTGAVAQMSLREKWWVRRGIFLLLGCCIFDGFQVLRWKNVVMSLHGTSKREVKEFSLVQVASPYTPLQRRRSDTTSCLVFALHAFSYFFRSLPLRRWWFLDSTLGILHTWTPERQASILQFILQRLVQSNRGGCVYVHFGTKGRQIKAFVWVSWYLMTFVFGCNRAQSVSRTKSCYGMKRRVFGEFIYLSGSPAHFILCISMVARSFKYCDWLAIKHYSPVWIDHNDWLWLL